MPVIKAKDLAKKLNSMVEEGHGDYILGSLDGTITYEVMAFVEPNEKKEIETIRGEDL